MSTRRTGPAGDKEEAETLKNFYERAAFPAMRYLNLYRNTDTDGYPSHWHSVNEIEFIMPIQNDFTVVCDGETIRLKENEILIIPHGCEHSLLAAEEYGERIIFMVDLGLLCQFKEYRSLFSFQIPLAKIDASNPGLQKEMGQCIRELEQEYFSKNKMRNSSIYALVIQILVMLARGTLGGSDQRGLLYPEKLAEVIEFIENHCADDLTLPGVSRQFGYSEAEFMDLLKQYTKLSFSAYLTNIRINRAEELLTEHYEYSIEEVAQRCGFRNYNVFVRIFKEKKGCTPSEYRNHRY